VLVAGCGWKPAPDIRRTLTIDQVIQSIHTLDGKTVKVGGYMATCGGYDCGLFSTEQASRDFWRIANDSKSKEKFPEFLSIGYDAKFDRKAGPLAGHYVVVTGQVSDRCRDTFGRIKCTDRAPDIIPNDIALESKAAALPNG
jgi:hypothetical protein